VKLVSIIGWAYGGCVSGRGGSIGGGVGAVDGERHPVKHSKTCKPYVYRFFVWWIAG